MKTCSCKNAGKTIYFCPKEEPCNNGQALYCVSCLDFHDHKPLLTYKKLNEEA